MAWIPIEVGDQDGLTHYPPSPSQERVLRRQQEQWLTQIGVPPSSWYADPQRPKMRSRNGDAGVNHTVWLPNIGELAEFASNLGFPIEIADFLDIGSGAGIASLYAIVELHFASAFGIELDEVFLSEARSIVSSVSFGLARKLPIEFEHADAAAWRIPETSGPLFIFLFNPFGPETLRQFLSINSARFPRQTVLALANDRWITTCLELFPSWPAWRNPQRNLSLLMKRAVTVI